MHYTALLDSPWISSNARPHAHPEGRTTFEHTVATGYIGIMEKKVETTIMGVILGLYRGSIRIMDKKMETTI